MIRWFTSDSLYEQIFLNRAVTSVAPDADLDVLPAGGVITDPSLSDHLPALQAALGVSAADAALLFALTDNQLTLANLSALYRVTTLAGVAKLKIADLIAMAQLLSPGATAAAALVPIFASPSGTLTFLSQVKSVTAQPEHGWIDLHPHAPHWHDVGGAADARSNSLTVTSAAGFPGPNFYISIGSEILQVTSVSGPGNTIWAIHPVVRMARPRQRQLPGQASSSPTAGPPRRR